ncbi:MAG: lysophospholipid acyltransferase family protein [bacterium]
MKKITGALRFFVVAIVSMTFASIILFSLLFNKSGRLFHWFCRHWAGIVVRVCGTTVSVRGFEHVQAGKGYVYVSNHASMFDIPAVIAVIPDQIRLVYKKELEKIPIFGWGLKYGSYIGIDRGRGAEAQKSLDEAVKKIQNGESVLLFAEGTRTLDGRLQPFKRGAFHIAVRAGVPVVPLTINGSYAILPKHSISINPGTVELILEKPIYLHGEEGKETELQLMEEVHAAIEKHYVDQ